MRWHILRTLLHKEALRHATNRGGLVLAALLVTASLLLAALNPAAEQDKPATLVGGIHHCLIWYDDRDDWVIHLEQNAPPGLRSNIRFLSLQGRLGLDQHRQYDTGTGGIEIRSVLTADGVPKYRVYVRYPDGDRAGMAVYENWFWKESYRYFHSRATAELRAKGAEVERALPPPVGDDDLWAQRQAYHNLFERYARLANGSQTHDAVPDLELRERPVVGGALDLRAAIATALVMFCLCFTCVYLMPSLTCEERERGLLLAQALSPATAAEILAAKFLFYPAFGIFLATLLAGIHNPAVLGRPFFWMSLATLSVGTLGIGMTVACLAKTQRAASLGALCYMLVVALVLLVCQQNDIGMLPRLALEYHAPHILHATLTNQLRPEHWWNLLASAVLACVWAMLAVVLFRKRGWQ
jgi:ABC-2 type transporter